MINKDTNVICLIFARGGSKGIKKKNLLPFKNTTLLGNSIKQSKKCKIISDTYVSTENNKIIKEAEKNKAKIILRPKKLSTSTAHEIDAWKHAIIYLKKKKIINSNSYIISLPTTGPLRNLNDINRGIATAISNKNDITFGVTESYRNPYFNIFEKVGKKIKISKELKIFKNRQSVPKCYDMTTCFYIFKPNYILNCKHVYEGKIGYSLIPKERSIDIDDTLDYMVANFLSKKQTFS